MKKEGTGKPQDPDIALAANVRMRELRFDKVPDPEVRFRGDTRRNSVWTSRRTNLPDEVQEDVVYRDAGIRLRIATEVVGGSFDAMNSLDYGGVKTNPK
jgi:hypothetical protein